MRMTASPVVYGMNVLIHQPAVQPAVRPVEPGIMQIVQRHNGCHDVCHLCERGTSTFRQVLDAPMILQSCTML